MKTLRWLAVACGVTSAVVACGGSVGGDAGAAGAAGAGGMAGTGALPSCDCSGIEDAIGQSCACSGACQHLFCPQGEYRTIECVQGQFEVTMTAPDYYCGTPGTGGSGGASPDAAPPLPACACLAQSPTIGEACECTGACLYLICPQGENRTVDCVDGKWTVTMTAWDYPCGDAG